MCKYGGGRWVCGPNCVGMGVPAGLKAIEVISWFNRE